MRRRLLLNYTSHATRSYDDDEICKVVDFLKKYPCSQIRLNDSYKLGFMTDSQIEYLFDNALNNLKITIGCRNYLITLYTDRHYDDEYFLDQLVLEFS